MRIIGSISRLFEGTNIFSLTNEDIESLIVGLPIRDDNGTEIGVITSIDQENDKFFGMIDTHHTIHDFDPICTLALAPGE